MIEASLHQPNESKIVLLVLDGLGGLPTPNGGLTELETARTPHLDGLVQHGICGLHEPVGPGITPGSGPGHLALFGYEPTQHVVGRGVLSALGIGFDLESGDVAARGNFCTLNENGEVVDRRAGRPSTRETVPLCEKLDGLELEGARVMVRPVRDHRFLLVLRGDDLRANIDDTDPGRTGVAPSDAVATEPEAKNTATLVDRFVAGARELLADDDVANGVLLRGFSQRPSWPSFRERFGVRALAVAGYPMYRGVTRLLGMNVCESAESFSAKAATVREAWNEHDFFFVHVKGTDSAGEDGDFNRKVSEIEEIDRQLPELLDLGPDVVVVTGDHSTPALLRSHSWHPVPVVLCAETARRDLVTTFGERPCGSGHLGPRFPAHEIMPLAIGHAGRFKKFGA